MRIFKSPTLQASLGLLLLGLVLWPGPTHSQAAGRSLTTTDQIGGVSPAPRATPTRGTSIAPAGYGYYPTPEMTPVPQPTTATPPAGAVTVVDFGFQPDTINISPGETVRWTFMGSVHTTTSDTGLWDSGLLTSGQSFSLSFTNAGTFSYYCRVHPTLMRGTVNVVASATTPTPGATVGLPAVGGHGFGLQNGSPGLYWTAGTQQTGYIIVRWSPTAGFAFLPSPTNLLGANATSYTDPDPLSGPTCYVVLPLGGTPASFNQVLGLSDLLCLYPNSGQGNAPQSFAIRLDESSTAKLSWAGPGGQDNYQVIASRFDGSTDRTISVGNQTSLQGPTNGLTTCYQVVARAGSQELGRTNRSCAVPGVGSFPSGGAGRDARAALERITGVGSGPGAAAR